MECYDISILFRTSKQWKGLHGSIGKIFSNNSDSEGKIIPLDTLANLPYELNAIAMIYNENFEKKIERHPKYYYALLYPAMEHKNLICSKSLFNGIIEYQIKDPKEHLSFLQDNIKTVSHLVIYSKTGTLSFLVLTRINVS